MPVPLSRGFGGVTSVENCAADCLRKPHARGQRDILHAQLDARHVTLSDPQTRRDFGLAQAGPSARLAQTPPEFDY
jgi:hypothetical protein